MLSCEWIALGRHGCSRRPRLSIMKLHRIKQTRGWPWLFLSLYLRARGGSRARVSRTCTGAPVGFPIIGWQADDSVQRTHETRTRWTCLSHAIRLTHPFVTPSVRVTPPIRPARTHHSTCAYIQRPRNFPCSLSYSLPPSLYPPMTLHPALRRGGSVSLALSVSICYFGRVSAFF